MIKPSFGLGVALAAAIPYAAVLLAILTSLDGLGPEERAFRKFAATIIGVVGPLLFVLLAAAVFGAGRWVLRRVGLYGVLPYALWGAFGSLLMLGALVVLPPEQNTSGLGRDVLVVGFVGAAAGAAFWLGAIRRFSTPGGGT